MDNQKRVSVAFSECELEYVDDLQEEFKKKHSWRISRHALLKMAFMRGLEEIYKNYEAQSALPA